MNTSNTFLRYFNEDEKQEVFISIANLDYSGTPIDDNGDDLDNDECLYRFDSKTEKFVLIWQSRKPSYIIPTMNSQTKTRGRPKGAVSLVNITLKQLNELFGPDTAVPVGSIWLRNYGVSIQAPAPIMVTAAPEEREVEPMIQFTVTHFDKELLPDPPEEIFVDAE